MEASAAYSKGDFAYRMSVASREARETNFWLLLLIKSQMVTVDLNDEIESCDELMKLLTSIVKSSQDSLNKNKH